MAVYTKLNDDELLEVLSCFSIAPVKYTRGIVKGSENSNYFVETTDAKYVLTIFEERTQKENIPYILDSLSKLGEQNIICPNIIAAKSGQRRYTLPSGKTCILQTFMDGDDIEEPSQLQCYAAGKTLANIHKASGTIETKLIENNMSLQALNEMVDKYKNSNFSAEQKDAVALIIDEIAYQQKNVVNNLPSGFIHGDYFKDNILFTETFVSGVIDFWFSCVDNYIYDLAIALNAWGFQHGEFKEEYFSVFLKGYTDKRALTNEECKYLPLMLRLTALRFMMTRLYDQLNGKSMEFMANKPFQTWQKRLQYHQTKNWEF